MMKRTEKQISHGGRWEAKGGKYNGCVAVGGGDDDALRGFNVSMAVTCCFNLPILERRFARLMESSAIDKVPSRGGVSCFRSTASSESKGTVVAGAGVGARCSTFASWGFGLEEEREL